MQRKCQQKVAKIYKDSWGFSLDKKVKEIILKLYFEEGKKQKEIADILEISKYKVSRILNNDERYLTEKDKRKALSQQKHKKQTSKKRIHSKNKI